jgi:hypothetical protein
VDEAGEEDITMAESATAMTTATIPIMATSIEPEVETGDSAANVLSDPAQWRQEVRMDHGRARDRSRTVGGRGMSAGITKRERRNLNQSSSV